MRVKADFSQWQKQWHLAHERNQGDRVLGRPKGAMSVFTDTAKDGNYIPNPQGCSSWLQALVFAQLKDAYDLLRMAQDEVIDPYAGYDDHRLRHLVMDYWETVAWVWHEKDPGYERIFSLDWCCMVLRQLAGTRIISSEAVRDHLESEGLKPAKPRRRHRSQKVHVLARVSQ